ncbi:Rrf2 family transcriptional regulator [bacterium]|nr:Rrf2 family transcriptional regulator [bacterium]
MRISSLEEYGLRVALSLLRLSEGKDSVSAAEIARAEGISAEYASKILHLFKKSKLVVSQRGSKGGFRLALDSATVPVSLVLAALQDKKQFNGEFCQAYGGTNEKGASTNRPSVQPLWKFLFTGFDQMLDDIFLSDLLLGPEMLRIKIKDVAAKRFDRLFEKFA